MTRTDWWQRRKEFLENRGWIPSSLVRPVGQPRPPKMPKRPPAVQTHVRELSIQEVFTRNIAVFAAVLIFAFLVNLLMLGHVQQQANQQKLRNALQQELAAATAPTSEGDINQVLLKNGTPVALLRIPELGVDQVVVEGTDGISLKLGPGHRRDTVLPGQEGTAILMGRAWSYGGPFGNLQALSPGSEIEVITGQGRHTFAVIGVRYAGDPAPAAPGAGVSRLVLESARGSAYSPTGVVRVDAQMISTSSDDQAKSPETVTPAPSSSAIPTATAQNKTVAAQSSVESLTQGSATPNPVQSTTASPTATPSPKAPSPNGLNASGGAQSTAAFAAGARYTLEQTLPLSQREMATDTSQLWVLVFALQFLVVVEVLAIWAYRRFGFERAWLVAFPIVLVSALAVADQVTLLLPNLL